MSILIKELKITRSNAGILIISARNSLDDKLKGLNLGSDDYLVKPFHLSELNARINAILRRRLFEGNLVTHFNELTIDHRALSVKVSDHPLSLTPKEFDLLNYFIINKNKVLTQSGIVEHLWNDELEFVDSYTFLYTHIRNLRKKLQDAGAGNYLKSIYSVGYIWTDQ